MATRRPSTGDPFAVLRIPYTATADDAARAFRRLAFETHPDHNPGTDGAAFRAIRGAADALRTPADIRRERRRWEPAPVPDRDAASRDLWRKARAGARSTDDEMRAWAEPPLAPEWEEALNADPFRRRPSGRVSSVVTVRPGRPGEPFPRALAPWLAHATVSKDENPLCPVRPKPGGDFVLDVWSPPVGWAPVARRPFMGAHVYTVEKPDGFTYGIWMLPSLPPSFVFGPPVERFDWWNLPWQGER